MMKKEKKPNMILMNGLILILILTMFTVAAWATSEIQSISCKMNHPIESNITI